VESAISVRHRLKNYQQEGNSWSVCGEVYRYGRRFERAWEAYAQAEQIFQGLRSWAWLGLIYQEQAICLFQADAEGIILTPGSDPVEVAKQRITQSLDLCRDLAIRNYPSALNRAGRIFGAEDVGAGLAYLDQGARVARTLLDGWFWFANLIEHAELCYRAWVATGQSTYRTKIAEKSAAVHEAMGQLEFPDLKGRWRLLQGHLDVHDSRQPGNSERLASALEHYKNGFLLLAQGYVGSSGAAAIAGEFKIFKELVWGLPDETRALWQEEFRRAWTGDTPGSTLLLARLEELY
jgi:tetratricopeptide (TPR) repeat protein